MTLYLHVGPSKTASSLGQRMFEAAVPPEGLVYPRIGMLEKRPVHHVLARHLNGNNPVPGGDAMIEEICTLLATKSVLLSSEEFPHAPESFRVLTDAAQSHGHEVVALFVARDPITRMNSMYGQIIKTLSKTFSIEDFAGRNLEQKKMNPKSRMLAPWTRAGFKFWILPFVPDDMTRIYRVTGEKIGLRFDTIADDVVNPGVSAAAIRMCREYGTRLKRPGYHRFLIEVDKEMGLKKFFGFGPGEIAEIRERLAGEYTGLPIDCDLYGPGADQVLAESYPPRNVEVEDSVYDEFRRRMFARLKVTELA